MVSFAVGSSASRVACISVWTVGGSPPALGARGSERGLAPPTTARCVWPTVRGGGWSGGLRSGPELAPPCMLVRFCLMGRDLLPCSSEGNVW